MQLSGEKELLKTPPARKSGEQRDFLRNRRGRRLFYALHMPIRLAPYPAENVWILCNPLLEEKVFSQGIYVQFARFLAGHGYTVLRFDYEGDGDSEGEFEEMNLPHWRDDILDMAEFLRQLYPQVRVNLFGLRFGAVMAALAAAHTPTHSLLFWEPVQDGKKFITDHQKINFSSHLFTSKKEIKDRESLIRSLTATGTMNIAGYDINDKLLQQIGHSSLPDILMELKSSVQIAAMAINRPGMQAERLEVNALSSAPGLFMMINSHPFWLVPRFIDMQPEDLFGGTLDLIRRMDVSLSAASA